MNEASWFGLFAGFALKSTVALGVAWLVTLVLRSWSAAARHLVWTATSAAVLAVPFLSLSLPALRAPSFAAIAPSVAVLFETSAIAHSDTAPTVASRAPVQAPMRNEPWRPDWRRLSLLLWAIGAAASSVQMLLAFAAIWRTRRSAAKSSPESALGDSLAHDLGITHHVAVFETAEGSMPMTCGFLRPAIFMPADAETWTEERRRMVLLHELAHVKRGDVATHLLARLALILNWWNPLAWFAWREFLKERERATDDLVLATGARASEYAAHLLDVARSMQTSPALAWAAVAMARRSQLEGRLVAILDSRMNRKAAGRASTVVAMASALVVIAPFAAVRAQDQQQTPSDIDATIRAATSQNNYDMLEKPAAAFVELRQYDAAKKLLDAAVAIREQLAGNQSVAYGVGLTKLGDLEKNRDRTPDALAFYSKAAQILGDRPEAVPALIYLGEEDMLRTRNYAEAFDYFQKARNADPANSGRALMWMAVVREREQNPTDAKNFYRSAVGVEDPNSSAAATTLELFAQFLKRQGQEDDAKFMSDRAAVIRKNLGTPAQQESAKTLRIGNGVLPPKLLRKVEPAYTEEARAAQYQGTVVLSVVVGPDGIARDIRVVRGLDLGLDQNAVAAIQQWQFQPATKDGAAVAVAATIEVNFRVK